MHFGCIADDFTGGSDIASFFVKGGFKTVLYNGIPDETDIPDVDVCVIALKTRTEETKKAIKDSIDALKWLQKQGAQQFYIKYCSTFDSTPKGNIGPICDAAMEELDAPYTIICPALPVNGRTVKNGCLYVDGVPLHKSPMKDHPLTPMWDYDLVNLMEAQSKFASVKIPKLVDKRDLDTFIESMNNKVETSRFYLIPDYEKESDAKNIVELFGDLKLITGGSGLAEPLANKLGTSIEATKFKNSNSPALILSGSCSEATRNQIKEYEKAGGNSYFMDPLKLLTGEESVEDIWSFIKENSTDSTLIYSSDTPENVRRIQKQGKKEIAELLENTMAEISERAVKAGYHRLIVAGGETSGAVTKRLGYTGYYIGESIAPGVPIMIPIQDTKIRIVLKSGNFGSPDFFKQALTLT